MSRTISGTHTECVHCAVHCRALVLILIMVPIFCTRCCRVCIWNLNISSIWFLLSNFSGWFFFLFDWYICWCDEKKSYISQRNVFSFSFFDVQCNMMLFTYITSLFSFSHRSKFFYFSDICVSNANNSCIFKTFVCQVIRDCDDSLASIFPSNKCATRMRLIECTWNLQGTAIKVN